MDPFYDYEMGALYEQHVLEQNLVTALSNMKQIISYGVTVYPLTNRILNAMNTNNIQLKKVKVVPLENDQLTEELQLIQSSKTTSNLEKLEMIGFLECIHIEVLGRVLYNLSGGLPYLTHLTIGNADIMDLLIVVLQNLPMLESLSFKHVEDDSFNRERPRNRIAKHCKLKALEIDIVFRRPDRTSLQGVSRDFELILKSCPRLEKFKLSGYIKLYYPAALELDFLEHHATLAFIDIGLGGCAYYTLNDEEEEKRWLCFTEDLTLEAEDSYQEGRSFHINLTYSEGQTKLRLADCRRLVLSQTKSY